MPDIRRGTKLLYELLEGDQWKIFGDIVIVINPNNPPKVILSDGTIEELKCLPDPPSPSAK